MELKDFVAQTCNQILDGVIEAQKYAGEKGATINPRGLVFTNNSNPIIDNSRAFSGNLAPQLIDFDIAVTTSEGNEVKAGIGIFAGPLSVGTQGRMDDSNIKVNRIKFTIPILFPYPPT
jgi:hypothetical protein